MISPYYVENNILREMKDPRIHFAINCASKSCPPLGNRILEGEILEKQLKEKTINFINDTLHVNIDKVNKIIYLNKIFKWYEKDFIEKHKSLNAYIYNYIDLS